MSYYLPLVLINSVGLSNSMSRLLSACNATSYFVFACVAVIMVERFGRRGLMLMSTFGQFACFLIITILLRFAENDARYGTASVAFFFLYYIAFGIGMLGVPWLYPTEINSLPMRTKGAAVSSATNWYVIIIFLLNVSLYSQYTGSRILSLSKSHLSGYRTSGGNSGSCGLSRTRFLFRLYTTCTRRPVSGTSCSNPSERR
jgi:hypothetical protein